MTPDGMAALMGFPPNTRVDAIYHRTLSGEYELYLEHPDLREVNEFAIPPLITPAFKPGGGLADWGYGDEPETEGKDP